MTITQVISNYLDHKPIGGTPLSNAILMRGQRISSNVCLVENVLYKREGHYVYGQFITDDRSFAKVSGIPKDFASHKWFLFNDIFRLEIYKSHMVIPYYDWIITLLEHHKCFYKIDAHFIYLYAISHSAANTIATEVVSRSMVLKVLEVYAPVETATDFKCPGILWAMESFMSRPNNDFNRGLFEGASAAYCAITGARISVDYYDKSFIVIKGTQSSEHKCFRLHNEGVINGIS